MGPLRVFPHTSVLLLAMGGLIRFVRRPTTRQAPQEANDLARPATSLTDVLPNQIALRLSPCRPFRLATLRTARRRTGVLPRPAAHRTRPRLWRGTVPLAPFESASALALSTFRWEAPLRAGRTTFGTRPDRRDAARLFLRHRFAPVGATVGDVCRVARPFSCSPQYTPYVGGA